MYNTSVHFVCPSCGKQNMSISISMPTYIPTRNMDMFCPDPSCGGHWDVFWSIQPYKA